MLYFVLTLVDIKMKQSSHPSLFLVFANLCLLRFPACLEMRALGAMYIVVYCSMSLSCLLTEQKGAQHCTWGFIDKAYFCRCVEICIPS